MSSIDGSELLLNKMFLKSTLSLLSKHTNSLKGFPQTKLRFYLSPGFISNSSCFLKLKLSDNAKCKNMIKNEITYIVKFEKFDLISSPLR